MPGKCKKKFEMKKVEFVPYPVKEYVPIPMKHMEHMPMEEMPMHEMPMEMPMEVPQMEHADMDMGFHGLSSKRHVTRARSNGRNNNGKMTRNRW